MVTENLEKDKPTGIDMALKGKLGSWFKAGNMEVHRQRELVDLFKNRFGFCIFLSYEH